MMMSRRQARRLQDHLTLDTTRNLYDPTAPGFAWIIGVAHRTVSTKPEVPQQSLKRRRSERLKAKEVPQTEAPGSEPEKKKHLSILGRIHSTNSQGRTDTLDITEFQSPDSETEVPQQSEHILRRSLRVKKRQIATLRLETTVKCKRVRFEEEEISS